MELSISDLTAFNAILLVAILSPGAGMLFFVRSTVMGGRAAGIASGIGLGTMAALWTLMALLGLEAIFALFPWTYLVLKIGGATYLIYLAVQTWRHANDTPSTPPQAHRRAVVSGALVNLGNPKSVLFAASVIVVVFPQGLAPLEIAVIVLNHWLIELTFYTLFALLLTRSEVRAGYMRLKSVFDRVAATLLGALGVRLLMER